MSARQLLFYSIFAFLLHSSGFATAFSSCELCDGLSDPDAIPPGLIDNVKDVLIHDFIPRLSSSELVRILLPDACRTRCHYVSNRIFKPAAVLTRKKRRLTDQEKLLLLKVVGKILKPIGACMKGFVRSAFSSISRSKK